MTTITELHSGSAIGHIAELSESLHSKFEPVMRVDHRLTRALVSFQDNKHTPGFRWYHFREAFSAALVSSLLDEYETTDGTLLDPFAGSGTALFAAAARGMIAEGIELLPIGQQVINARRIASKHLDKVIGTLQSWLTNMPWQSANGQAPLGELRITTGAYPPYTKTAIQQYMYALDDEDTDSATLLRLALFCVLESVSYTRKDGQYLRWDHRADRSGGKHNFEKSRILSFDEAIAAKLQEMLEDLTFRGGALTLPGEVQVQRGSCLDILPVMMPTAHYDVVFTSPPYCNRYDYTRTYALELALLGIDEVEIVRLRQSMVSCTVENRTKNLIDINPKWQDALDFTVQHPLLSAIDGYLEDQRAKRELNNSGIPRMVRGYFAEMACVIAELSRVLKPGGRVFMVNDNVRYAGVTIPVDLILSDIAECLGLETEEIRVLPKSKGNSSQQMGRFEREPLRKCIYIWKKR